MGGPLRQLANRLQFRPHPFAADRGCRRRRTKQGDGQGNAHGETEDRRHWQVDKRMRPIMEGKHACIKEIKGGTNHVAVLTRTRNAAAPLHMSRALMVTDSGTATAVLTGRLAGLMRGLGRWPTSARIISSVAFKIQLLREFLTVELVWWKIPWSNLSSILDDGDGLPNEVSARRRRLGSPAISDEGQSPHDSWLPGRTRRGSHPASGWRNPAGQLPSRPGLNP
jgi:hypothetical protein